MTGVPNGCRCTVSLNGTRCPASSIAASGIRSHTVPLTLPGFPEVHLAVFAASHKSYSMPASWKWLLSS